MKRIIIAVLFLLLIIEGTAGAALLQREDQRRRGESQALVTAAEDRLSKAKADLAAMDPSTVEGEERQLAVEQSIVDDAIARAQALETENETLDADILQAQAELDAAKAKDDYDYYLAVYEELQKGMEKVEGYIEGN